MNKIINKIYLLLTMAGLLAWPFCGLAYTGTVKNDYPRLANYYLRWDIPNSEVNNLAKWDVLVLDMEVQHNSLANLRKIRQLNPKIIILAYVTSEEILTAPQDPGYAKLRDQLQQQIDPSWWLKDKSGNFTSFWSGTRMLNVTNGAGVNAQGQRWNDFLPQFINSQVMSTGLWDGVFYDNVWPDISWFNNGNLDYNNDGQADGKSALDAAWAAGNEKLLGNTQALFGGKYLIVSNSRHDTAYQPLMNGIMLESFPAPWEADGTWAGSMKSYTDIKGFAQPYLGILNSNTNNTWAQNNYHKMRFSLGSALLGDGSFSFDYGVNDHSQTWWYDEYQAELGPAVSSPINILDKTNKTYRQGLWRRDFENGIVVVNSTGQTQNYATTDEVFTKLSGAQDPIVNNGSRVNLVSIAADDAVVLLGDLASRKIPATAAIAPTPTTNPAPATQPAATGNTTENVITNAVFKNGVFFRAFDQNGNQVRNGFFAYDGRYPGGAQIITADIDNDKANETIVNFNGTVTIYRGTKVLTSFKPFNGLFKGDISLAIADLNGTGRKELVIGAGRGGGPQVRIFSTDGRLLSGGFFAYDRNFRGGVNVAAIDYNNDGKDEIFTGAGFGGGPQVRIFNGNGKVLGGFFAYDKNSRSGVSVTVGNLNGTNDRQIITGAGPGAQPQVRVWDKFGKLIAQFLAYDKTATAGITVAAADINHDGKDEILAGNTSY
ncbi:MAG TPA: putative glycoside hydrolase [Candidatus Nanoarchaeia archaeon]|nr:putative glycoside hydrolase [Candidatus Nanoarchaeia archaeon]